MTLAPITHASTQWQQEEGEWFDSLARQRAEFQPRREFSARASLRRHEGRFDTPARSLHRQAVDAAVTHREKRDGEAGAGLVSVPTKFQTALAVAASDLDAVLMTDEAKAKRRLSKLRCAVGFAARGHAVSEKGHRDDKAWMVTLTYRPGVDWASNHVQKALLAYRNWCRSKGIACRYVWIAEIQDGKRRADGVGRNVIHYHAVVWLPVGVRCPHFDRRGWWPHGMSRTDPPVQSKNPVGYLLHYLKKDKELAAMPKGARAYGVGGLDHAARRARRWLGLPAFVQGNASIADDWRRAPGGGWLDPDGGHWPSEFIRSSLGGHAALLRVHRHPRLIDAAGPFNWITQ